MANIGDRFKSGASLGEIAERPEARPAVFVAMLAGMLTAAAWATPVVCEAQYSCVVGGIEASRVPDSSIQDIAMATWYGGMPTIIYNPSVAASFPHEVQVFFFYHECAHLVLGHGVGGAMGLAAERQADCMAASFLMRNLGYSSYALAQVAQIIATYSRADWSHLPGPYRAIDIASCSAGGYY